MKGYIVNRVPIPKRWTHQVKIVQIEAITLGIDTVRQIVYVSGENCLDGNLIERSVARVVFLDGEPPLQISVKLVTPCPGDDRTKFR